MIAVLGRYGYSLVDFQLRPEGKLVRLGVAPGAGLGDSIVADRCQLPKFLLDFGRLVTVRQRQRVHLRDQLIHFGLLLCLLESSSQLLFPPAVLGDLAERVVALALQEESVRLLLAIEVETGSIGVCQVH